MFWPVWATPNCDAFSYMNSIAGQFRLSSLFEDGNLLLFPLPAHVDEGRVDEGGELGLNFGLLFVNVPLDSREPGKGP